MQFGVKCCSKFDEIPFEVYRSICHNPQTEFCESNFVYYANCSMYFDELLFSMLYWSYSWFNIYVEYWACMKLYIMGSVVRISLGKIYFQLGLLQRELLRMWHGFHQSFEFRTNQTLIWIKRHDKCSSLMLNELGLLADKYHFISFTAFIRLTVDPV